MDIYATFMTGLQWGIIANACWIIPYFLLLFYHFYQMENSPAYAMRYGDAEKRVKRFGAKEAVIEDSQIRTVSMRLTSIWSLIKKIPGTLFDLVVKKKGV